MGPAILVAALVGLKKAGDVENQAAKEIEKMDVNEAEKRKLIAVLDAVLARVAEQKDSTVRLKNELENLLGTSSGFGFRTSTFPSTPRCFARASPAFPVGYFGIFKITLEKCSSFRRSIILSADDPCHIMRGLHRC